jgi:hypothetical protein
MPRPVCCRQTSRLRRWQIKVYFTKESESSKNYRRKLMDNIQESLFGKTSSAHSTPTEGLTSGSSSTKWLKQGRWQSNGVCWMHNTSEYPNDEGACSSSLSSILSSPTDVQTRYYLSPKACQGILRRANRRGKVLPPRLQKALEQMAFDTQFGSNANVTEDIAPTLKSSQQSPSVAYCIQGNVIGRQDHNGPAGKGHTEDGDPMFTLTSTDIHRYP